MWCSIRSCFFRCAWAKYDEAKPGTLHLIPPDFRLRELQRDYDKMQIMVFGKSPTFQEIMDVLVELESTINSANSVQEAAEKIK